MISRARFTSAAGALRERVSDYSTRALFRSQIEGEFMPHIYYGYHCYSPLVITYHINKSAGVAPLQDFEPVGRSAIRPPMPTPFRT